MVRPFEDEFGCVEMIFDDGDEVLGSSCFFGGIRGRRGDACGSIIVTARFWDVNQSREEKHVRVN